MASSRPPNTMTAPPRPAPVSDAGAPAAASTATEHGDAERYLPRATLGQGGMGIVTLVHDPVVGRDVALKEMFRLHIHDAEASARFRREAQVQGGLEHPAVVPVYDIGFKADGSPFFTMKRVHGESLSAVLAQQREGGSSRFSLRKLLAAFAQVCLAAHYAHERGVVHRDIKPSNIMLGNYGDVYLLDWGVAKHAQQTVTDGVVQSSPAEPAFAGGVIGTPRTMAPEQAAGGNVDARADVYALGAVLFEILTLHPLHPEGGFDTVLPAILAGVDARPSVRYPEREVAPELEDLCVRATKLHASERMESALALSQGIESFLDGDRDLQLRRDGAQKHATLAKDLADAVLAPAAGDGAQRERERTRALREVGKALALDAHNAVALGTLVRLLTTPPAQAPREVLAEQLQVQRRHLRIAGVALSIVYAYISLNALATWSLGVRNMSAVVVAHVLWGLALAAAVVTAVRPRYLPLFASCFFGVTTCAYLTSVYSPLLPIVPTLLVVHGVLFAFVGQMRLRLAMIAYTALAWTFSSFAATLGLLPQTVRFEGGDITIHSNVIDLPASGIPVYMYAAVMAMLVAPAVLVGRLRGAYQRSDDAMRLQAWQLRQLVSNDEGQPLGPTVRG